MTAHSAGRALTKNERTAIYSIQALLLDFGKQNVGTSPGLTPFQRSQNALADLDYIKRRLQEQEADSE